MTDRLPAAKFPPFGLLDKYPHLTQPIPDIVNNPAHYTHGKYETIDVIEDAIQSAPNVVFGSAQGQVLKYVLRLWHKDNALQDAKKARWYLARLIDKLENT